MSTNNNENISYLDDIFSKQNKNKTSEEVEQWFANISHLVFDDQKEQMDRFKNQILEILEKESDEVKNHPKVQLAVIWEIHKVTETYRKDNYNRAYCLDQLKKAA